MGIPKLLSVLIAINTQMKNKRLTACGPEQSGSFFSGENRQLVNAAQCRMLRAYFQLSVSDFAELSGVSRHTIYNFEKSKTDIQYGSLLKLTAAFHECGEIELLGENGVCVLSVFRPESD